jgi:hypothetical protein
MDTEMLGDTAGSQDRFQLPITSMPKTTQNQRRKRHGGLREKQKIQTMADANPQ